MHNILKKIIEKKQSDLKFLEKHTNPFLQLFSYPQEDIRLIGEIKIASPTEKSLGDSTTLIQRAIEYERSEIDALSVITEKHYFKGNTQFIPQIKEKVSIPILQKDFVIDSYQIYESKFLGADALLLIVRFLDVKTLKQFVNLCKQLGIEPVVEIHNEEDLKKSVQINTSIIAVNARNL